MAHKILCDTIQSETSRESSSILITVHRHASDNDDLEDMSTAASSSGSKDINAEKTDKSCISTSIHSSSYNGGNKSNNMNDLCSLVDEWNLPKCSAKLSQMKHYHVVFHLPLSNRFSCLAEKEEESEKGKANKRVD